VPVRRKGSIFIGYRHEEAGADAGRLAAELRRDGYPVFIDFEMRPATIWPDKIQQAVSNCAVLLAVIGPDWLEMKDAHGAGVLTALRTSCAEKLRPPYSATCR
jgi:hypothetical protein